jgi:hypothetical protein
VQHQGAIEATGDTYQAVILILSLVQLGYEAVKIKLSALGLNTVMELAEVTDALSV